MSFLDKHYWKVSAKWLGRRHECTLLGISTRCGGRCCSTKGYWPPMSYTEENKKEGKIDKWIKNGVGVKNELYSCGMLGPKGCTFADVDKPLACLLYPVTINSNGTMVLHHRCTTEKGVCRGNHNNGPKIIDVIKGGLIELFGEAEYNRVRVCIYKGIDTFFKVPDDVWHQYYRELIHTQNNVKPQHRSMVRCRNVQ